MRRIAGVICVAVLLGLLAANASGAAQTPSLARAEARFADWLDAVYAVSTVSAGPQASLDGRDLTAWTAERDARRARLSAALSGVEASRLDRRDRAALTRMRQVLADAPTAPAASTGDTSERLCALASDSHLDREGLSRALYGCFERFGDHIAFEGRSIARTTALELLQEMEDGGRRRALFAALTPLWTRINGADEADSPYRRLIRLSAADARSRGASPITRAARTVGLSVDQVEADLTAALAAWRDANPGPAMEPWDYWNHYAGGVRPLDDLIPSERVEPLCKAYYRDLGVDLDALGVVSDLAVRPGKAPLAYTDFISIGRYGRHGWVPARVRVSANVEHGGLFVLNEIIHENGHATHMMAIRTRPAFFDLGDDLFLEAFADVTSWSVAEPGWQARYLGRSVDARAGLRAMFASVMLDVAWGLFELRMLRAPDADPNAVWTDITSRYLNIRPHPELAWWALRVQLVDEPGYMINYGLGAMITADLRQRFRQDIGPFDAGNPKWGRYAAERLLRFGASRPSSRLLRDFLHREVSIEPLTRQIARIGA